MKYACIARYRGEFKVRLMCRVLSVSPSGFYASERRSPCEHALKDQMLSKAILEAHKRAGGLMAARACTGSSRLTGSLSERSVLRA